jgi:DNA-binding NtrC family response regulator
MGTTFNIYLPIAEGPEGAEDDELLAMPTGTEHIMVVDDEPGVATMASETLRVLGYTVDEFIDSRDALRAFRDDPARYDAIVTDQTMPHFTGTQLLASMSFIRPELPVVISSGFQPRVESSLAGGGLSPHFLSKPYTIDELARMVRRAIDEARRV